MFTNFSIPVGEVIVVVMLCLWLYFVKNSFSTGSDEFS